MFIQAVSEKSGRDWFSFLVQVGVLSLFIMSVFFFNLLSKHLERLAYRYTEKAVTQVDVRKGKGYFPFTKSHSRRTADISWHYYGRCNTGSIHCSQWFMGWFEV